jgi:hypothetical protein
MPLCIQYVAESAPNAPSACQVTVYIRLHEGAMKTVRMWRTRLHPHVCWHSYAHRID